MGDDHEAEEEAPPQHQYRQTVNNQMDEAEEVTKMFGEEQVLSFQDTALNQHKWQREQRASITLLHTFPHSSARSIGGVM